MDGNNFMESGKKPLEFGADPGILFHFGIRPHLHCYIDISENNSQDI